ncbi:hypothetical protein CAPGI0001_0986 [Capnocytophaga gingivalis ATCC 33624]|nr:hypothetical protein CAPGI0001_0986 [Capnocytophaga gingivalis ATCC 33624]
MVFFFLKHKITNSWELLLYYKEKFKQLHREEEKFFYKALFYFKKITIFAIELK